MQTAEALTIENEYRNLKRAVSPCSIPCQVSPSDSTKNTGIDALRQNHGVTSQRFGICGFLRNVRCGNTMQSPMGGLVE